MALRRKIGEILEDLDIVSQPDLTEALQRQQEMVGAKALPDPLERIRRVTENRMQREKNGIPFLGQLLITMGIATERQVLQALQVQRNMLEKYCNVECEALVSVMDLASTVNSSLNLAEVLSMMMENANLVTQAEASTLMLVEDMTGDLVFSVPTGPMAEKLVDVRIKRGQGIAGWVAENEKPLIVNEAKKDDRFFSGIDKMSGFETDSVLAVPLKAKNRLIGVLEVLNKKDGSGFTEEDALLLTIFSEQAAMAIENARLYGELEIQIQETLRMQEELARSEKFRALAQLSTGIAHDFKNILNAIMGFAEISLLEIDDDQVRQDIVEILTASNRAKDLLSQILVFTSKSAQNRIPVSSRKFIRQACKLFQARLPSTIEMRQNLLQDDVTMMADLGQIHQALVNLLQNAQEAIGIDNAGTVEIETALVPVPRGGVKNHPAIKAGDYFKIIIRDDGCGMDEAVLAQAFEPYFTTKEKGMGTGMGLATVLGTVKGHGGSIHLTSAPSEGTTCEILLPIFEQPEADTHLRTFENLPTGSERVLIIDDEKALVKALEKMLVHLGYQVTPMSDSEEALELFRENPDQFDIVITDIFMPRIRGDRLAQEMTEIRKDIPVIIWTALEEEYDERHFSEVGVRERLKKPLYMAELAQTVRKVLDES
jgi:signal transduction histidine kinase